MVDIVSVYFFSISTKCLAKIVVQLNSTSKLRKTELTVHKINLFTRVIFLV